MLTPPPAGPSHFSDVKTENPSKACITTMLLKGFPNALCQDFKQFRHTKKLQESKAANVLNTMKHSNKSESNITT